LNPDRLAHSSLCKKRIKSWKQIDLEKMWHLYRPYWLVLMGSSVWIHTIFLNFDAILFYCIGTLTSCSCFVVIMLYPAK